jgi:hypothetical protein
MLVSSDRVVTRFGIPRRIVARMSAPPILVADHDLQQFCQSSAACTNEAERLTARGPSRVPIRAIAGENHIPCVPVQSLAGCITNTFSRPLVRDAVIADLSGPPSGLRRDTTARCGKAALKGTDVYLLIGMMLLAELARHPRAVRLARRGRLGRIFVKLVYVTEQT